MQRDHTFDKVLCHKHPTILRSGQWAADRVSQSGFEGSTWQHLPGARLGGAACDGLSRALGPAPISRQQSSLVLWTISEQSWLVVQHAVAMTAIPAICEGLLRAGIPRLGAPSPSSTALCWAHGLLQDDHRGNRATQGGRQSGSVLRGPPGQFPWLPAWDFGNSCTREAGKSTKHPSPKQGSPKVSVMLLTVSFLDFN